MLLIVCEMLQRIYYSLSCLISLVVIIIVTTRENVKSLLKKILILSFKGGKIPSKGNNSAYIIGNPTYTKYLWILRPSPFIFMD